MTTTLPLFWHLSSASKKERLDASVKLIGALEQFQSQFVPKVAPDSTSGSEEDEDDNGAAKSDSLDTLNSQDVSYSIRRLIRGLASPRESSRLGFAVALTELLSRLETITCSQIITLIKDGSKSNGSMTGQEERDILFARLFGLTAVLQSGLLTRAGTLNTSASGAADASTLASFEETLAELLALGEKKSWLRESSWWAISSAIDALKDSQVTWKDDAIGLTINHLFVKNTAWSPEKVALALKLQTLYPDQNWKSLFLPSFKDPNLLHSGNLHTLARILKESALAEDDIKTAAASNWKPQLHFVWDIALEHLLPSHDSTEVPRGSFEEFFRVVVDESLFSSTASAERKYWGFQVFRKVLPRVTQSTMPMLFTKNFMRTWINHLSHQDRYLHKIAQQIVTDIQVFVQSNSHLGFALILQLTGANGSQQFDKLTRTKTVASILTSMDANGIKIYIQHLLEQVNVLEGQPIDVHAINSRRAWIIEQLGALIRNGSVPKNDDWVQSVLDWLCIHGLFVIKKPFKKSAFAALHSMPSPAFSDDLRRSCRTRLLSCIADLNSQVTVVQTGGKTQKMHAITSEEEFWISNVLKTIHALEENNKYVSLCDPPDDEILSLCTKAQKIATRIRTVNDERQGAARGVEFLLLATTLMQYFKDEDSQADVKSLKASIDGASKMFPEGKKSKKAHTMAETNENVAEPIDILVDIIIGFLEKSTAYSRTVGNQVFALLCGEVRKSTVDLIVAQLEHRAKAELLKDSDEDDDDDDDEEGNGENDESESSPDDDGDGDSNDDEEDVELRNKIEETLRMNGIDIDVAAGDSDEEELMDDDQMMAIDEQLAAVFKSRAEEKKSGKDTDVQREATHFKNRVLDLVETFIKKQFSNPLILHLIPCLVDLVAGTGPDERQLSDKAKGILRSLVKSKDTPAEVDVDLSSKVLTDLHQLSRRAHNSDLSSTLSQCSLYLSKILIHAGSEKFVSTLYQQSLADFIKRKNSALHTSFFQDFIQHYPAAAWALRIEILSVSTRAVNVYRQSQAYHLLGLLFTRLPAMGDVDKKEVTEFASQLHRSLLEVVTGACKNENNLSPTQIKEVMKLALVATRQTQRLGGPEPKDWQPYPWKALATLLGETDRFKKSPGLQKMCEQVVELVKQTGGSAKLEKVKEKHSTRAKRKVEDSASNEPEQKTRRKKAKV